jgi:DNA-binding NarL/FixJ family response regulator
MTDIKTMPIAELERLVAAEIARRRSECLQTLEGIAAGYGFTLADFAPEGAKRRLRSDLGKPRARRAGTKTETVVRLLRDGKNASEIAAAVGWQNSGAVYNIARQNGIAMKSGRAA